MIYFDTFGASGGVGRVTLELLAAFRRTTTSPVKVAGLSHVIHSLAQALPSTEPNDYLDLTPPRFSWRRLRYEIARRSEGRGLFDFLWSELNQKMPDASLQPVLVNFPQVMAPPRRPVPASLFIHDLNWRKYPQNFLDPDLLESRCRKWVEKSKLIFTNSEFTRQEILEAYSVDPKRVVAAPLAPFPVEKVECPKVFARILAARGLVEDRFYLYPAIGGAHKGHDILTKALGIARATFPVVVTCGRLGKKHRWSLAFKRDFERLIEQGRLIVVSHLSNEEMDLLRHTAHAFLLPSLYEGYGFPLAEAISLGKPVLCSDIPAYSEILLRQGGNLPVCRYPSRDYRSLARLMEADFAGETIFKRDASGGASTAWTWSNTAQTILQAMESH